MKTFYISLTYDLIGYYLRVKAESESDVRQYLQHTYLRDGIWKLPWCSIYTEAQFEKIVLGDPKSSIIVPRTEVLC